MASGAPETSLRIVQPPYAHPRSIRWARGISEALFSSEAGPPPAERLDFLCGELSQLLLRAGWRTGGVYRLGLFALTFVAPLFIGRLRALWKLPLPDRVRALQKMERSGLATAVLGVKAILCIIYYEHPDALREAGVETGCHGRKP